MSPYGPCHRETFVSAGSVIRTPRRKQKKRPRRILLPGTFLLFLQIFQLLLFEQIAVGIIMALLILQFFPFRHRSHHHAEAVLAERDGLGRVGLQLAAEEQFARVLDAPRLL